MNIETSLNAPRGRAPLASGALVLLGLACAAPAMAAGDDAPLCTDRPTKSNAACTVPEGKVQVEADLFSWTRIGGGPVRTDVLLYSNPTVKVGLGPDSDIQLNLAPLVEVRSRANAQTTSRTGVGDLTLRFKQRLTGPEAAAQVAVIPFVKAPTAQTGIGNGEWEGGLIVPVQLPLGKATMTLVPQLNLLAGALAPSDRHIEFQGVANLAWPIARRVVFAAEMWTSQNWDPAGTVRQYSADAAVSYLIGTDLQLDVGGNLGLNSATPDVQLYLGISARF